MRNVSLYIDLAFCIIVFPAMALIFPVERWWHNFPWYVVSVGIWLYSLYLINRFVTVPCLFRKNRASLFGVLMILASFVVTCFFTEVKLYVPQPSIHDVGINRVLPNVQPYQQAVWSLFMIVEAFSFAVGLLTEVNIQRSRRRMVEAQRDRAEIDLYKAQIKPHFMFNTLNSLYGLFLTKDEKALVSLEKFISMSRYIHTISKRDMVPLSEEADYIKQYVDLQSLRLNEMTRVSLEIDIRDKDLMVAPMLLVTFVENCFKHGISSVEPSDIEIRLMEKNGKMVLTTSNKIFPVARIGEHLGIENCRKRLDMLYPSRHSLKISDSDGVYNVKLCIELAK